MWRSKHRTIIVNISCFILLSVLFSFLWISLGSHPSNLWLCSSQAVNTTLTLTHCPDPANQLVHMTGSEMVTWLKLGQWGTALRLFRKRSSLSVAFSKLATIFVLTMWGGTCLERKPLQRKVEPRNGDKFWTHCLSAWMKRCLQPETGRHFFSYVNQGIFFFLKLDWGVFCCFQLMQSDRCR